MKSKTAVEWLCENIYTIQRELSIGNKSLIEKVKQAKEMEKQQRHYAYQYGREDVFDWLKKMDYDFLVDEINKTE